MTNDEIFSHAVECLRKNEVNTSLTTFRVDINWLAAFARVILQAQKKNDKASTETHHNAISIRPEEKTGNQNQRAKAPPPGCVDHDDMLRVLWARRQISTLKEIGDATGLHPTIINQVLRGDIRMPVKIADLLGFERIDQGKESWFRWTGKIQKQKFNLAEEEKRLQETDNQGNSTRKKRSPDGTQKVVRSSAFEGLPKVKNPGPFQQLLDRS